QLDGPPKFALRRWPVPVVEAQLIAERRMGLGERGLERERLEGSGSRFRHAFAGEEIRPTRQCKVRVGDAGVHERISRIMRQGLLEVRERLLDGSEAALVVEVASLEIQLVRLDVVGGAAEERQAVSAHQVHL